MMTRPVGHRRDPNDSGVALLLALFLIVFVGVLAGAALTYAGTSLNASTLVYLPHRSKSADAESAIRAAIQYVKRDQQNGGTLGQDLGLPCPTGTFSYAGASGPVAVTICPQDGSLIQAGEYRASILTLGTDPGEGIKFGSNGQNDV